MSSPIATPSKGSRAKHQHSKSAAHATTGNDVASTPNRNQRRQRNNRNNHDQNQVYGAPNGLPSQNGTVPAYPMNQQNEFPKPRAPQGPRQPSPPAPALPNVHQVSMYTPGPHTTPAKKSTAYAGPTFHASPAPSSLPVPRFFSKSVPASTNQPSLQSRLDADSDKSVSPPSTDVVPAQNSMQASSEKIAVEREESPLDIFFRADRAEKAKRSNAMLTPDRIPSMPTHHTEPPRQPDTRPLSERHHSRHVSNGAGGLFPMELDGTGADRNSPVSSLPGSGGQAPASRSVTGPSSIPLTETPPPKDKTAVNKSLRDMLLTLPDQKLSTPLSRPQSTRLPLSGSRDFHSPSPFYRPNSLQRSSSGPSTPVQYSDSNSNSFSHYGNRNLSPLFKAAQNDSVKRSSSLRQEVNPTSPTTNGTELHTMHSEPASTTPSRPSSTRVIDPNSFSRNYLNTHIQLQAMPDLPITKSASGNRGRQAPPKGPNKSAQNMPYQSRGPQTVSLPDINVSVNNAKNVLSVGDGTPSHRIPNFGTSHSNYDAKSVEDDLRRMLNLNVGSVPGVR